MARNKYPQETVEKILSVSMQLFLEKGYERTTIQDIIDRLGGLTKGAIYHHFKNKEAIFYAIAERGGRQIERDMQAIRDQAGKTGLEKLREMFLYAISGSPQYDLNVAAPNMLNSPWLLAESIRSHFEDVIPHYIYPVMLEGVEDGSIRTEHPKELAEVALVLTNIWLGPMVHPTREEEVIPRIRYCDDIFRTLGLELFTPELRETLERSFWEIIHRRDSAPAGEQAP